MHIVVHSSAALCLRNVDAANLVMGVKVAYFSEILLLLLLQARPQFHFNEYFMVVPNGVGLVSFFPGHISSIYELRILM